MLQGARQRVLKLHLISLEKPEEPASEFFASTVFFESGSGLE